MCEATTNQQLTDTFQYDALIRMYDDREQQDRVRFAAVMAYNYLNSHSAAADRLTAAMARQASVAECIRAIEQQ
jgi:hypothetical protein